MAFGINAEIVSVDDNKIKYVWKCPKCGKVKTTMTFNVTCNKGTYVRPGGGNCQNCGEFFDVEIHND